MQVLGISRSTLKDMRDRGRLKAYRSPSSGDNRRIFNRRRYWFYKKDDVQALLNSPEYQRKRKAYWKARMPWAYEESTEDRVPSTESEDNWHPHEFDHSPSAAEKMKMEMEGW